MNFICKQLTLDDDGDFGCTIGFSDSIDEGYHESENLAELINSNEKYFLVQRSYSEDFDEDDYYYIETTESDIELSYKDKLYFDFNTERVKIRMAHEVITIGLNLKQEEYKELKKLINKRFRDFVVLVEE